MTTEASVSDISGQASVAILILSFCNHPIAAKIEALLKRLLIEYYYFPSGFIFSKFYLGIIKAKIVSFPF